MTAVFVAANYEGIAVAADTGVVQSTHDGDSTVSRYIEGERKLYPVPGHPDVVIASAGIGTLHGVPWTTLVGGFSQWLGNKRPATVCHYAHEFAEYLKTPPTVITPAIIDSWIRARAGRLTQRIQTARSPLRGRERLKFLRAELKNLKAAAGSEGFREKAASGLRRSYGPSIREEFASLNLSKAQLKLATDLVVLPLATQEAQNEDHTLLLFAGYGDAEAIPSYAMQAVFGVAGTFLHAIEKDVLTLKSPGTGALCALATCDTFSALVLGRTREYHAKFRQISRSLESDDELRHRLAKYLIPSRNDSIEKAVELVSILQASKLLRWSRDRYERQIVESIGSMSLSSLRFVVSAFVQAEALDTLLSPRKEWVSTGQLVATIEKGQGARWKHIPMMTG